MNWGQTTFRRVQRLLLMPFDPQESRQGYKSYSFRRKQYPKTQRLKKKDNLNQVVKVCLLGLWHFYLMDYRHL